MKRSLAAAAALLVLAAVILTTLSLRLDGTATPCPSPSRPRGAT